MAAQNKINRVGHQQYGRIAAVMRGAATTRLNLSRG